MRHAPVVALFAFAAQIAGPAVAQSIDLARSAACQSALDALQAREAALLAAARAPAASQPAFQPHADPQLLALRRRAALACLGSAMDPRPASAPRGAQAPIAVPPITGLARPALPRPSATAPAGAPPRPAAPTLVMSCDPAGCWTDTGERLSRIGTELWGPRGPCTGQGLQLRCP